MTVLAIFKPENRFTGISLQVCGFSLMIILQGKNLTRNAGISQGVLFKIHFNILAEGNILSYTLTIKTNYEKCKLFYFDITCITYFVVFYVNIN